jgi:Membrane domain of glycerophosphoryl diester phosphodiesterase
MRADRGFRAAWRFYGQNFRSVFVLSLLFYLVITALAALSVIELGALVAVFTIVYLIAVSIFWLQAPLARLMDDVRNGRPNPGARRTLVELGPRLGSITGGTFVGALGVAAGWYVFVAPGVYLLARWALLIPVIVIESKGAFRAFGRSNRLVRGHTWRVVLELLGSFVMLLVIWSIAISLLLIGSWVAAVAALVFLALATPPIPLMRVLSYYDLREIAPPDPVAGPTTP